MYAVIVGAGEVGSYLARILVAEGHDVALVERDRELAARLDASLDALVVPGSGVAPGVLRRAGIATADLLLAVTALDEVNLVACMTGRKLGGDRLRAIARVRQSRLTFGEPALGAGDLGLDALVSPEQAIAKAVGDALRYPGPGEMRELAGGRLVLVGMELGADSPLVHEPLAALREGLPDELLVVAVKGSGGLRVPSGADRLSAKERAFVLARPDRLTEVAILSGQPWHRVRRVLVTGCGNTGLAVAQNVAGRALELILVERDREQAELAAHLFPGSLVRHADGADPGLLRAVIEEEEVDTVVALLPEAERAVLAGILAKSLGARKVIVRCDDPGYSELTTRLGVDLVLSPKRAMADSVLEHMRWSSVVSAMLLGEHELEIIQMKVPEHPVHSGLLSRPLKLLGFPRGSLVGAVLRGEEVFIGSGETILRPGDEVLVVARPDVLADVETVLA